MARRGRQRRRFADELRALRPRHEVHVRVHLQQAGRRLRARARAVAAQTVDADRRQLLRQVRANAVPGRSEHRDEAPGRERAQRAESVGDSGERRFDRLGGGVFGLLLAGRGAIAMVGAVLQHGDLVVQHPEQLGLGRLGHDGERERHGSTARQAQQLLEFVGHGAGVVVAPPEARRPARGAPPRQLASECVPAQASHSRSNCALRRAPPRSTAPAAGRGAAAARSTAAASVAAVRSPSSTTCTSPLFSSNLARSVCSDSAPPANGTSTVLARACSASSTVLYPAWLTESTQFFRRSVKSSRARSTITPSPARFLNSSNPLKPPPVSMRQGRSRKRVSRRASIVVSSSRPPTAPPPAETRISPFPASPASGTSSTTYPV